MSRSGLWCLQMVIPESDLSTLEKVDASAFNVTTYKAAYTKQVRQEAHQQCKSMMGMLMEGPHHALVWSVIWRTCIALEGGVPLNRRSRSL